MIHHGKGRHRLRLTIITNNVYAFGGGEKWSLELAKRLSKRFKIQIINIHSKKEVIRKTRKQIEQEYGPREFNLVDLDARGFKRSAFGKEEYTLRIPKIGSVLILFNAIKNSDVVYQVSLNPIIFFYAIIFSRLLRKKLILGVHNPVFFKIFENGNKISSRMFRALLREVKYAHVLNFSDMEVVKKYLPSAKIYKIRIFITKNSPYLRDNRNKFIVLYVGRLSQNQKGIDLLRDIIGRVAAENDDVKFHIVGAGGDGERIVDSLSEKYVNVVKRLGFLDEDNLEQEYNNASLFVLPSRYEGLPAVVIEAQLHGLPFVAFDVKGPADIFEDKAQGVLIKPFRTKDFATSILKYFECWKKNRKGYIATRIRIKKTTYSRYESGRVIREMEKMIRNVYDDE